MLASFVLKILLWDPITAVVNGKFIVRKNKSGHLAEKLREENTNSI